MSVSIEQADCIEFLRSLPEGSVQCCVTSPPYYALRDYKTAGQIGLEKSPALYIARMVEVFREVRRVLRDDGTCWVNIGDSWNTSVSGANGEFSSTLQGTKNHANPTSTRRTKQLLRGDLKPLDMCGIPWTLALGLRADGWHLRSEIIWAKTAPMPESLAGWRWERCRAKVARGQKNTGKNGALRYAEGLNDSVAATWQPCPGCKKCQATKGYVLRRGSWRPTKAHEQIFLFTKTANYFADGEPVKTAPAEATRSRDKYSRVIDNPDEQYAVRHDHETVCAGANLRDLWLLGPEPLADAHYAAFPSEIPRRCILAGTSAKGCCPACGASWARVVEATPETEAARSAARNGQDWYARGHDNSAKRPEGMKSGVKERGGYVSANQTIGWRPSCPCDAGVPVPSVVLDPFTGSGTTALVARNLGRDFVGCDISEEYVAMARRRLKDEQPLFT